MKPQIILRVDDVGRKPGDTPEGGSDGNLSYFFNWREAVKLHGFPVVYGVTCCWLNRQGFKKLQHLNGFERVALHGWDHKPGPVSFEHLKMGGMLLDTEIYIPPFNKYDFSTITQWKNAGGRYFMGGFNGDHHDYGTQPMRLVSEGRLLCYHIPAYPPLYEHAEHLATDFSNLDQPHPVVATLHVPWDTFELAARFVEAVKPYLVPLDTVDGWIQSLES